MRDAERCANKTTRYLILLMLLNALCLSAGAAPIGLFNTGVDSGGALLPGGATDPHYTLITSADPSYPGPAAIVVNPSGYPIPPWTSDGPNSAWIAPAANESIIHAPGLYVYRTTFNLAGLDPSTALITGQWSTDNTGVLLINGVSTGATSGNFDAFTSFTIGSGFVSGLNTLDFAVTNGPTGGFQNPTGLRVELSGTAAPITSIPEPGCLVLLGSGLVGIAAIRKRFKI